MTNPGGIPDGPALAETNWGSKQKAVNDAVKTLANAIMTGADPSMDSFAEVKSATDALSNAIGAKLDATAAAATYVPVARLAKSPELLISGAITRDANGAATSAPVTWPDGSTGVYTATTVSAAFPGAVDAYTVTYVPASGPTKTYTQSAVTRDTTGAVTSRPEITVA